MPDLADGETVEMKGSGANPYVLKNVSGVYSCSCPAWRNQSLPIEKRTCKHLRKLRGDEAEESRTGGALLAKPARAKKESEGPPILLAQKWDNAEDLTDWWISEKLDAVRAYWDGKQFLSRQGNVYHAPDWFLAGMPDVPLDGELWLDRKAFQRTVSIVRRQDRSDHWKEIRFLVFDAPQQGGDFETRLDFLADCLPKRSKQTMYAHVHDHQQCKGLEHLREELAKVESIGGEGLMLRQPRSQYEVGRSITLLKVKTFHDAEAVVIDHQAGKGKHKGKLGSMVVRKQDGVEFSVGTGFSDAQRASPPPVGSVVTFRYQELTDGGVPRFPSFVRVRELAQETPVTEVKQTAKSRRATKAKKGPSSPKKGSVRHFEFVEGKSNKFWEVAVAGLEVTVRYGRIGSNGTTKTKEFSDVEAAEAHADKLIKQKSAKGYVEKAV